MIHIRKSFSFRWFAVGLMCLLYLPAAAGVVQEAYVKASNAERDDQFGFAVAISGDTMVAGAPIERSRASEVNGDQSDNSGGNAGAAYVFVRTGGMWVQQAYLKPFNAEDGVFGWSVAISGNTIVVGAPGERSNATGVNGDETNMSAPSAGAAYVFVRNGTTWSQQAYLKASNTEREDQFGRVVAISGDTIAVAAIGESSRASGINGDQNNNDNIFAGAVYVFARNGTQWTQEAYLKASNNDGCCEIPVDVFGVSVAISADTIVVGAFGEDSSAAGVNGNQNDNDTPNSGAAYVFVRQGGNWSQQAYLKASNPGRNDSFGAAVGISGNTIVVGANGEASSARGINGDQSDNSAPGSGAAYVFVRNGTSWMQQAYLKPSNTEASDDFGGWVAISGDAIVVGASQEDSSATGVNGDQHNNSEYASGAAYVFVRNGMNWSQQAYLKASNTERNDVFGQAVGISGGVVVIGARFESSNATGINGDQGNNNAGESGAVYVFTGLDLPPADADRDGVLDPDDECPDTRSGAIVDARGCSIEQLVPCDGPWRSHGHYLQALRNVTDEFVEAGLITNRQQRAILLAGAQSDCGKPRGHGRDRDDND